MKMTFLFFLGLIAILSTFYIINPTELQLSSFSQVFAQSEDKNNNFDDAKTIHSSQTITSEKTRINNIQEKNFDDTKIIPSSDTATKEKSKDKNGENRNFDEAILSQSSDTSTIANQNNKTSFIGRLAPSEFTKIHPAITQILEHANPKAMAKIYGASIENDRLFVYVHLADNQIQNKPSNIEILAQDKNIIVSKLSLNQIKSLADLDSVARITLPDYAVVDTHIVSEGVSFSLADEMHMLGFNGTGINVAIIDTSFITSNSEISGNIVNEWFGSGCADMACNVTEGSSHGTAVAEIVVDMAPNVNLWLYTIKFSVDFNNAVDNAIANNVDIITASLGFPTQGGNDNATGWYRDGTSTVAQKVNEAKSNGSLFTMAAGNQGEGHWSGNYDDATPIPIANLTEPLFGDLTGISGGYDSVLNFNASASGNMRACLPVNNAGSPYLINWNAWPTTSTEDYDVFLYSRNMTDLWNGATATQNPTNLKPLEGEFPIFNWILDLGEACLVVVSFSGSEDHFFHIDIGNNILDPSYIIPSGSLDTPADATGALAVGAITFSDTTLNYTDDALEVFSSQGPTDDGRAKPEICGPDGTLTSQTILTGGGGFFGTSASTPHVAGAAALLLELNPNLTVDELRQKLIDNAREGDFSQDNLCGSDSGSLALFDPPPCQSVPSSGTWTVDESCTLASNSSMGSLIVQNSSSLKLDSGVTLDLDSGNSLSINPGSILLIKSGASLTFTGLLPPCVVPVSGDWIVYFDCIMSASVAAPGNVIVQNNGILTIPTGVTLDIDFENFDLIIKSGGQVLVKSGGDLI